MNLEFRVFDKDNQQFIELGGDTFIAFDGRVRVISDGNYLNADVFCSVDGKEFELVKTERICKNCESCTLFKTECTSKKLTDDEKYENIKLTVKNEEIDLGCRGWKYNGI